MENSLSKLRNLLGKSKNILLLLPGSPSADVTAAGLVFYLSLKETGKQVVIACPEAITVNLNRLVAVDKITDKIGSQNLVVSFDYVEDSIEKVSYNISEGKFNLVIEPKEEFPPLDPEKVSYSYTGAAADLIIIIGAPKIESLGKLWEDEKKVFIDQETVNIDTSLANSNFGKTNLVDPQASSRSELVGLIVKNLNLPVNADIATNLIAGIESATSNFTRRTRAETFEVIAWCLKNGGRRGQLRVAAAPSPFDTRAYMVPPAGSRYAPALAGRPAGKPAASIAGGQQFPAKQPFTQPAPVPTTSFVQPTPPQQATFQTTPSVPEFPKQTTPSKPPSPDWLKPKIYRGKTPVE